MTPFGRILREAVEGTPGAVGGAFAASDGEMVDAFTTRDRAGRALDGLAQDPPERRHGVGPFGGGVASLGAIRASCAWSIAMSSLRCCARSPIHFSNHSRRSSGNSESV